jgi:ATP-dependent Clp protease ATP-binding subunit ClpC
MDLTFPFDLRKTAIFQAVVWEDRLGIGLIRVLRKILTCFFIFSFIFFLYLFLANKSSVEAHSKFLGLSILSLSLTLFFWLIEKFFGTKLKNPPLRYNLEELTTKGTGVNFAEFLDFEAAKAIWQAISFSKRKRFAEVPAEAILYFILNERNPKIKFICYRAILDLGIIRNELKEYFKKIQSGVIFSEKLSLESEKIIFEAIKVAQRKEKERIGIGDLLAAQSRINNNFKKVLIASEIKSEDMENLSWWAERIEKIIEESKKFWEYKNLVKRGTIGRDFAAGYTITLDQFSTDWTEIIRKRGFEEIIGHKQEVAALERILARQEINNVLLVGEPGAGRISIIHELARRSFFNLSLPQINSKRVVSLDIVSVLSRSPSNEVAEATLDRIFREAITAGNVILVIDDFHNYIGQEQKPGIIDISGIISPYLYLPNFQIIAITNFPGLHKFIEPFPSILNLFEKVEVGEVPEKETIQVLENYTLFLEKRYKLFVTYQAIRDIVKLSARYLPQIPFPKKALDLLDEIMVYVFRYTKSRLVLSEHVARVISDKTQIPVGEVGLKEREVLLNLENLIHQRIINQEEAVDEISSAMRRARADITVRKGPMGGFLFLGPTGVGKTETSKALAEVYFGSEDKMIRLDMSEFQNVQDVARLLGSGTEEGLLTTPVRENPFSLILLDEIEKAHPNILNLFLQVLDEGYITDGLGRKVDFKNSIIIATSNAGYQVILEALKKGELMAEIKEKLLDFLFKEGIFRPEFINRFDGVIVFKSLTKENLLNIAELLLSKLKKNLQQKDIEFEVTLPLKEKITELGYDPVFGAREMRRVIQDKVENVLAAALLSGEIKPGDKVSINTNNFKLEIKS